MTRPDGGANDAPAEGRLGQAILRHQRALTEALSFKAGCAVIAQIYADVTAADALVVTIRASEPEVTVHVIVTRGEEPIVIDSREVGFVEAVPPRVADAPCWSVSVPGRLEIELRGESALPLDATILSGVAALLNPYFELTRRIDRFGRASSLFEVIFEQESLRNANDVFRRVVREIGKTLGAAAAYYPAAHGGHARTVDDVYVHGGTLVEEAAIHTFTALAQIAGGPIERAFAQPDRAAPVTWGTLATTQDGQRVNAMIQQLRIVDYVALPVVRSGQTIGVMASVITERDSPGRRFGMNDIAMVASLAFVAAWAIPVAEHTRIMRRSLQESEMLRHLLNVSYRNRNEAEILQLASNVAQIIFGADYVVIGSVGKDGPAIDFRFVSGNRTDAHLQPNLFGQSERARQWLQHPYPAVIRNARAEPGLSYDELRIHQAEGLATTIAVPFHLPNHEETSFILIGFRELQHIGDDELRFAEALVQTISAAL